MRIAIASIMQESNTFSPVMTYYEDFNPVFSPAVLERHQGRLTEVGGFISVLAEAGMSAAPVCAAWSITANRLLRSDFLRLGDEFSSHLAAMTEGANLTPRLGDDKIRMGGGAFLMRLLAISTIPVGSFLQAAVFCIVCVLSPNPLSLDGAETDEAPVLVHFRAAQQAIQRGDINRAVSEYKTVLRLDPTLVEARINLGLAYHMLGEYERAVSELAQGLHERPKVLGANVVLGGDYLKLGRPQKAIAPLKEALAMDPSNREARRGTAVRTFAPRLFTAGPAASARCLSLPYSRCRAFAVG
jgi:tetratricopeptide (TPR) repeat protein